MKKLCLISITLFMAFFSQAQQTIYVNQNATPGGNGNSWNTALDSLHEALVQAQAGDEIWVAKGTYTPYLDAQYQVPTEPALAIFRLKNGVTLYGGFSGNETSTSQRNWSLDSTIISGEIGLPKDSDNVRQLLYGKNLDSSTTKIDGLYITRAFNFYDASGGSNLPYGGTLLLEDCDTLTMDKCVFFGNRTFQGSGFEAINSSLTILNSVFKNNSAERYGGAAHIDGNSNVNSYNTLWANNFTDLFGGAIYNLGNMQITHAIFFNNIAGSLGGAIYNNGGFLELMQVSEVASKIGNGANQALRIIGPGDVSIYNSLFSGTVNTHISYTTTVKFYNSLLVGSRTANNTWRTSWGTDKGGNIDAKPLFVDSLNGNFTLAKCSPGIDAGKNNFIPIDRWDEDGDGDTLETLPHDYTGNAGIINSTVDMGAYEAPLYNYTGYDTVQFCAGSSVFYKGYYIDEAGIDTLVFQAAAGCDSTVYLQVNRLNVDTSVTVSADGATLTSNATGTSFLWFECNTGRLVFADTLPVFIPDTNGVYKVVIIDQNGCQDTSSCIAVTTIGLGELFSKPSVSVYPNPVMKEVWIKTPQPGKATTVDLHALDGRLLLNEVDRSGGIFRLKVEFLEKGVYILSIKQEGEYHEAISIIKN